jgi:hypothetical protein
MVKPDPSLIILRFFHVECHYADCGYIKCHGAIWNNGDKEKKGFMMSSPRDFERVFMDIDCLILMQKLLFFSSPPTR